MRISTETASPAAIVGEEKAVELIAKAGFDCWDFSLTKMADWNGRELTLTGHPLCDYKEGLALARRLKQIGLDNGITCNQSHAPFPADFPELRALLPRAIEYTAEAGGKICIIHPIGSFSPEQNGELYAEVLPTAKACGVKIAVENMWNWNSKEKHACFSACSNPEHFCATVDYLGDPDIVACLDIGHASMMGMGTDPITMIQALGHRLQALHIHDTDCWNDSHQIPFSLSIPWEPIVRTLKNTGYAGDFTLECNNYLRGKDADFVPQGLIDLAQAARKLADMFESY
ncbi:MAG: sugar phosphate isomerase/epimerase [Clostridia bacterium]|nr:sugar phosphate isomerase/epimerase [Clostridia bacterium]